MNDFTKKELQHIYDALIMLSKLGWVEGDITIRNKIKSMIDDYDSKAINVWHCEKCGHVQ